MSTLTINDAIFSTLRADPTVNAAALLRFVSIANTNPVLNAALSQAASGQAGPVKFRLATAAELQKAGAEAFFDYSAEELEKTKGFMSVALNPAWLVGPHAQLLAVGAGKTGIPATITHELDHYLRVASLRAIDDLADPAKTFPNLSDEQRFEAYATGRMQVEVMGWYASMKAQQFARTGSINGVFGATDLMALGDVERELYRLEQRAINAGLAGDSLEAYIAENGAPMLSKNQGTYWNSYVTAYADAMQPGVNYEAVRSRVAYKVESPDDVMDWQESGGNGQPLEVVVIYRSGNQSYFVKNPDGTSSLRVVDPSGAQLSRTTLVQVGIGTRLNVFDGSDQLLSSVDTQTDDDGNVLKIGTNADGSGFAIALSPDGKVISEFALQRQSEGANGPIDGPTGTLTGTIDGRTAVFAADFGYEEGLGTTIAISTLESINNHPPATAPDTLDPQDLQAYGFTWQNLAEGALPAPALHLLQSLDPATQTANGWAPPQLTVTDLGDGLTERRITLGSGVELASVRDDDRRVLRVVYQRDDTDSTGEPRRIITTENRHADGSVNGPIEDLSLRQTDSGDGWRMPVASKPRCSRRAARSGHRIHFAIHSKKRPFDAGYGVKIP